MKIKTVLAALAASATLALATPALADCELGRTVKLADGNWEGIQVLNSIAAVMIKKGFDCDTELVTGDMVPLMTALQKGDVDVFFDFWISNNQELWDKSKAAGAQQIAVLYPDATEGWYVPKYYSDASGVKTVKDLVANAKDFEDPEEPGKGRFYNCPIGWGCEQRNNDKITAYGMADAFVNFKPGSGAALDAAFVSAYKQKKPVVGYYWEPTWLLGSFEMVKIEEPSCTDTEKKNCASPLTESSTVVSGQFAEQSKAVKEFLGNMKTSSAEMSKVLAYLKDNEGSTRDDAAMNFLKTMEGSWSKWVSPDIAAKIKAGL